MSSIPVCKLRDGKLPADCRYRMSTGANGDDMVPMKKVDIKAVVHGAMASLDVAMVFVNGSASNPVEATYTMTIEPDTIFSGLSAQIDGREVEAKVMANEKAQQKYEDAVAGGNSAVIAQQSEKRPEEYTIKLGNLGPGMECQLNLKLIKSLAISGSSFHLALPSSLFPDYSKHGVTDASLCRYEFSLEAKICSKQRVSYLSAPDASEVTQTSESEFEIKCSQPGRTMDIYYYTEDMMQPALVYASDPRDENQVACQIAFVPTFNPICEQPQEIDIALGEKPEQQDVSEDVLSKNLLFTFLIDRSGSMGFNDRISIAKKALKLFLQSLPPASYFRVVSFGSNHEYMTFSDGRNFAQINNESLAFALSEIDRFSADFGGTDILMPLMECWTEESAREQRIICLTDGAVYNKDEIISQTRSYRDQSRVFTVGVGSGADKYLCKEMAKAGRGSCSMVEDGDNEQLNACVVEALSQASQPSYKDCSLRGLPRTDQAAIEDLGELFRSEMIRRSFFCSKDEFEALKITFSSAYDPVTKGPFLIEMSKADFVKVEEPDFAEAIVKSAAHTKIASALGSNSTAFAESTSVKYQVMCKLTSLIGVVKQKSKQTGELVTHEESFGSYDAAKEKAAKVAKAAAEQKRAEQQKQRDQEKVRREEQRYAERRRQLEQRGQEQERRRMQRQEPQYNSLGSAMQSQACYGSAQESSSEMDDRLAELRDGGMMMSMKSANHQTGSSAPKMRGSAMKSSSKSSKSTNSSSSSFGDVFKGVFGSLGGSAASAPKPAAKKPDPPKVEADSSPSWLSSLFGGQKKEQAAKAKASSPVRSSPAMKCAMEEMAEDCDMGGMMGDDMDDYCRNDNYASEEYGCAASDNAQYNQYNAYESEAPAQMDCGAMMSAAPAQIGNACMAQQPAPVRRANLPGYADLEKLITLQDVDGFWPAETITQHLTRFFNNSHTLDSAVKSKVTEAVKLQCANVDVVYTTLVALYVLEQYYGDKQAEWAMVAKKAKDYLRSVGITKPNNFLSDFRSVSIVSDYVDDVDDMQRRLNELMM